MSEQLTGPQDAPEGVRATTAVPEHPPVTTGTVPAAVFSPAPEAPLVASQGRVETYTVDGPDGRPVTVTRDLDTGEQTTTRPDGTTHELGGLRETPNANLRRTRGGGGN